MAYDDVLTRNENDELAVRTVSATEGSNTSSYDDVFTRTTDGKLAVRVVGAGGGGSDIHNLGYYATPAALEEAHPTAEAGDWAIVGSTDTVWVWDEDESEWVDTDKKGQVTSVNGQTGDVTVQETLVSGTNIKTINGNSVLGSGNVQVSGFLPFPAGWTTNSTTKAFCDDIAADSSAVKGMAYLGEVTISDMPAGIVNSEIRVYIEDGTTAANKVITLELTSGNVAPYQWQYVYWNNGTNTSGWVETGQQKQADWNQADSNAVDFIKNKPTIPTTAQQVGAVPQYVTLPTASSSNLGEVAQYVGVNIPDVDSDATITQTVGSGLSDLEVDVITFESKERPTGDETVDFTYVISEYVSPSQGSVSNITVTIDNQATFIAAVKQAISALTGSDAFDIVEIDIYKPSSESAEEVSILINQNDTWYNIGVIDPVDYGITYTGTVDVGTLYPVILTSYNESKMWYLRGNAVTMSSYGITYSGTPVNGDVLEVSYTAFVEGMSNSYFYKVEEAYSEEYATITQTVGSGLTGLSVNVDTFVEEEQPSGSETVDFVATSSIQFNTTSVTDDGVTVSIDTNVFAQTLNTLFPNVDITQAAPLNIGFVQVNQGDPISAVQIDMYINGSQYQQAYFNSSDWESAGIYVSGEVISDFNAWHWETFSPVTRLTTWYKNSSVVDLADYGISYSGTANTGDTLEVSYVASSLIGYEWNKVDYGTVITITTEV